MSSKRLSIGSKGISATDCCPRSALAPGTRLYIADLVHAGAVTARHSDTLGMSDLGHFRTSSFAGVMSGFEGKTDFDFAY